MNDSKITPTLKIVWVYDAKADLSSLEGSNPFTPLASSDGLCGTSTSLMTILRLQKLNGFGFACPKTRSVSGGAVSSAD